MTLLKDPRLTAPHPDAPTAFAMELGWRGCSKCRARLGGLPVDSGGDSVRAWHRRIYAEMLADYIANNGKDHT